jgi:hypothetical protein
LSNCKRSSFEMDMEIEQIRLEVYRQTGISIGRDDPFLVAIQILLAAVRGMEEKSDAAVRELSLVAARVEAASDKRTRNAVSVTPQTCPQAGLDLAAAHNKLMKFSAIALSVTALAAGGAGYVYRMGIDAASVAGFKKSAEAAIADANAAVAAAEKSSADEVRAMREASGWAGTAEGLLARRFFSSGAGQIAASCAAEKWDIKERRDGKYCVPQRRPLVGNDDEYGWKIP